MAAKVVKKSETTKHFLIFYLFIYKNLAPKGINIQKGCHHHCNGGCQ